MLKCLFCIYLFHDTFNSLVLAFWPVFSDSIGWSAVLNSYITYLLHVKNTAL